MDERLVDEAESGDVTDEAAGTVAGAEGSADTGVVAAEKKGLRNLLSLRNFDGNP